MEKNTSKKPFGFSKLIVYICLILLAITIIVPVAWVFLASVKQNKEFYGNPWTLPEKLYFQKLCRCLDESRHGILHPELCDCYSTCDCNADRSCTSGSLCTVKI